MTKAKRHSKRRDSDSTPSSSGSGRHTASHRKDKAAVKPKARRQNSASPKDKRGRGRNQNNDDNDDAAAATTAAAGSRRDRNEPSKWDSPARSSRPYRPRHNTDQDGARGDYRKSRHSRSRSPRRDNRQNRRSPHHNRRNNAHDKQSEPYEWGQKRGAPHNADGNDDDEANAPVEKEKPNFGLSGKLTEDANKVNGVVIKYAEPLDARKPKRRWRLYPFKGDQALQTMYIHRQSCYLIGRDRKICDLPVDHPSCSKQHAALQYRMVPYERDDGTQSKRVRPYIIDLESANGTFVNNKQIDAKKYVELLERDVIKFGFSSREYVVLHENSKNDEEDDDVAAFAGQPAVDVKDEPVND